jgi:hypothetical protein
MAADVPMGRTALPFVIQSVALSVIQFSGSEWIVSTPFDASLLTPEPPQGGSFFFVRLGRAAVAPKRT